MTCERANPPATWSGERTHINARHSYPYLVVVQAVKLLRRRSRGPPSAGYQAAYAGYQELSERYIAELKKPRITLGSVIGLIGAAGIGVVIGRSIP